MADLTYTKVAPNLEVEAQVDAAKAEFYKNDNADYNLIVVNVPGTKKKVNQVNLVYAGEGGLPKLREVIKTDVGELYFGVLKILGTDDQGSVREKIMFMKYLGNALKPLRKGRINSFQRMMQGSDGVFRSDIDMQVEPDNLDKMLSPEEISSKLLLAAGAHKPEKYVFGGGEEFIVSS